MSFIDTPIRSIDELFRRNRHAGEIYLATEEELAALSGDIPARHVTRHLRDWCFFTINLIDRGQKDVHLCGVNVDVNKGMVRVTSQVRSIAGRAVFTNSGSIYIVDGPATDQPPLRSLCDILYKWGLGNYFGVPRNYGG